MTRCGKRKARLILMTAELAVSLALIGCMRGCMNTPLYAQENPLYTVQTDVAVQGQEIHQLQLDGSSLSGRLDEIDKRLLDMNDRLSSMRGIGTGAVSVIAILQMLGLLIQARRVRDP